MRIKITTIESVYCAEEELLRLIDRLRSQYGKAEVVPAGKEVFPVISRNHFCCIGVSKEGKQYKVFYNVCKITEN